MHQKRVGQLVIQHLPSHNINMQVRHLAAMAAARRAVPRALAASAGPALSRRSIAAQFSARPAAFPAALGAFPLDRRQFSTSDATSVPVELSDGVGQLTGECYRLLTRITVLLWPFSRFSL